MGKLTVTKEQIAVKEVSARYSVSVANAQGVSPGYKQTEMGVIPVDWDTDCLGEKTTKVGSGITPTGGERTYKKEGRPFLRSQNVGWGSLELEDIAFIDDITHETFSATEIKVDDVFLNITGASIGRSAVADERVARGNVNQHVCIIRVDRGQLDPRFLNYFLLSSAGQRQIDSFQAGGNRQGLNFGQIRAFRVPLPPPPEQRAIAAALLDVDALIAALDKLIAKKRAIKTAAMQQLLTSKQRLPGFRGEWEKREIGEEIDLLTGFPFPSAQYSDSGVKLLRGSNIKRGFIDWADDLVEFWPEVTIDLKKFSLEEADIVVAMDGSLVGRSFAQIQKTDLPALLLQRVARIRSTKIDMGFLKHWICSEIFTNHCDSAKTVTAIPHISPHDIRAFKINIPSTTAEQKAIADILSDMDAKIVALEARRNKTKAIKQGMMQELLTGRIRLV